MLTRRTLELRPGAHGLPQVLISRQTLTDCARADEILAQARAQADQLLSRAQTAAETLLRKAHDEFWQQANAQLACWQRDHRALCQAIESSATQVVNLALSQLLDEVPPPARINTLLTQLLQAQCPPLSATLRCPPQALAQVRQWLGTCPDSLWQLQTDERLAPQALVLVTEQYDLRIDWATTSHAALIPDQDDGTDPAATTTES